MKKSIELKLELSDHAKLEAIQLAEYLKFGYLKKRRKEVLAVDIFKIGMNEFKKIHQL